MLQKATPQMAVKAVNDKKGLIEGYASLYGVEDSDGDVVEAGAFDLSLKQWQSEGRSPALLWQHDQAQPIGIWQTIRNDAKGLFVRGQLFIDDVAKAAEAYALAKRGALTGLSIGYRPEAAKRDAAKGVRRLTRIKLFEISLVTFPALESARISAVKNASPEMALLNDVRALTAALRGAMP